ncbi:hypothetical protein D9M71_744050 [compost metagenome]
MANEGWGRHDRLAGRTSRSTVLCRIQRFAPIGHRKVVGVGCRVLDAVGTPPERVGGGAAVGAPGYQFKTPEIAL